MRRLWITAFFLTLGVGIGVWWLGAALIQQIDLAWQLRTPTALTSVTEPWPTIVRGLGWVRPRRAADLLFTWGERARRAGDWDAARAMYRRSHAAWPTSIAMENLLTLDWELDDHDAFDRDLTIAERKPPMRFNAPAGVSPTWFARRAGLHGDPQEMTRILGDRNDDTSLTLRSVALLAALEPTDPLPASLPSEAITGRILTAPDATHSLLREQRIISLLLAEHFHELARRRVEALKLSLHQPDIQVERLIADIAFAQKDWPRVIDATTTMLTLDHFSVAAYQLRALAYQRSGDGIRAQDDVARAMWLDDLSRIQGATTDS